MSPKRARMIDFLSQQNMNLVWRQGKDNHMADLLSRYVANALTKIDWCVEQKKDMNLRKMVKHLSQPDRPHTDIDDAFKRRVKTFVLHDNILHKINNKRNEKDLIAVPYHMRAMMVEQEHLVAGHMGINKTYKNLREDYWWLAMGLDVKDYLESCPTCERYRKIKSRNEELHPIIVTESWHTLGMDIKGPLKRTKRGYRYYIVLICYFSKHVFAIPLKRLDTKSVMRAIYCDCFTYFMMPKQIISDRAKNFLSKLARKMYEEWGIKKLDTTAYHPQGDGLAERTIQTFTNILAKIDGPEEDWDLVLNDVCMTMRYNSSKTTEFSPLELACGRKGRLPKHFSIPLDNLTLDSERRKEIHEIALKNIIKSAAKNKEYYDKTVRKVEFHIGDLVWLRNDRAKSMQPKRLGPFLIEEIREKGNVKLKSSDFPGGFFPTRMHPVVAKDRLKLHNPNQSKELEEEIEPSEPVEWTVTSVTDHMIDPMDRNSYWYLVNWSTGESTWAPLKDLVEQTEDEWIINEALERYLNSVGQIFEKGGVRFID